MKVRNFLLGISGLANSLDNLALEMESAAREGSLEDSDRLKFGNRLLSLAKRVADTGDALIKFDAELMPPLPLDQVDRDQFNDLLSSLDGVNFESPPLFDR